MRTAIVILVLVVLALLVVAAVMAARKKKKREELRGTFGPEYDRTVEDAGSRRKAEQHLEERKERHDSLEIRPLPAARRERYLDRWGHVQAGFVDAPERALDDADTLLIEVLEERGYPVDDFDTRAEMLSVEHADLLDHYRKGHRVVVDAREGRADTESTRQAMLHFRTVFAELLHDSGGTTDAYPEHERPAAQRSPVRDDGR